MNEEVEIKLRKIGWYPGRSVREQCLFWIKEFEREKVRFFSITKDILNEFGGLEYFGSEPGQESATCPFQIDPLLCQGEQEYFSQHEVFLKKKLNPLGETHHGQSFLMIDEAGCVYSIGDNIMIVGQNFNTALETMLLGKKWILLD